MSASRATKRPEPDQRLLVLVAVGLALCLGPLLPQSLFPPKNASTPPAYLWLSGPNFPEGLYRLASVSRQPETVSSCGVAKLPLAPETDAAAAPRFASFMLPGAQWPAALNPPADLAPFFFAPIAVNQANRELLMTLPGIGPRLADGIIALRQQKKKVHLLDELLEIKGIGPAKIAKLKGRISFD